MLCLAELFWLEHIAQTIRAGCKHGFVDLHVYIVGLPVQRGHLDATTPGLQRVEIGGIDTPGTWVHAHQVAHVVLLECRLAVRIFGTELDKRVFREGEDVVVSLGFLETKATVFDTLRVNAEATEIRCDLTGLALLAFLDGSHGVIAVLAGRAWR